MGTALNALKLLDFFSASRPEIGLSQLARLARANKATVLRHLRSLEEFGLIEQNPLTKYYAIGPAAIRLAALREAANPRLDAARLRMQTAMQEVGESLHLSFLEKDILQTALVVETTKHTVRVSLDPTEVMPINATASGLSMLCYGPPTLMTQVNSGELQNFTKETLTDPDQIRAQVETIRNRGWSNSNGSYEMGVHGFAAPIFGIDRVAIGTVAFAMPENRASDDRVPVILAALHTLAKDLTAIFGGQVPEAFPPEFHP
ncbi:Acetate operon repressor [Falsiruegeria litorea R37]|uniref:Acetate operon repressor n=1 Tax=Falsiruegeria litorea R37 TaxID=1200284 RepID=A0A1Y5TUE3_9RHOB|nr:IclR family transcriptional regulator [Falsiruegeria litorea]SLN72647.1 Acetate operon repressor [Falsiruegeria litorea R37]